MATSEEFLSKEDVISYINAAGLEAMDSGNQEAEDRIAGIMLGIKKLPTSVFTGEFVKVTKTPKPTKRNKE